MDITTDMAISSPPAPAHRRTKTQAPSPGFRKALKLFKSAASRVPAYRDFLQKAKIDPEKIETESDFARIPPTDKKNYITKYDLKALSWDGSLAKATDISSSSGSTGTPFFWPRGQAQHEVSGETFRRMYEGIFNTKKGDTLWIDLFGLGTWLAGFESYNSTKYAASQGNRLCIITPGLEKTVAIRAVTQLSSQFTKIILAGYPPFIKDMLESGAAEGIDWSALDVRILTAGEAFSELWRDHVLEIVGKPGSLDTIINFYGMAEIGIVGHETPFSVFTRRASGQIPTLNDILLNEGTVASLYQYDPATRFFEVGADATLVLTANAGIPLLRYNTRDRGGLLPHAQAVHELHPVRAEAPKVAAPHAWPLPFVYLYGRRDLSLSLYAVKVYVENVKHAFETFEQPRVFSGLFTMHVSETTDLNQRFEIVVELARGSEPSLKLARELTAHAVKMLRAVNSEYAKLHGDIGQRVAPKLRLVRYGEIDTIPGRKHKWVKRG